MESRVEKTSSRLLAFLPGSCRSYPTVSRYAPRNFHLGSKPLPLIFHRRFCRSHRAGCFCHVVVLLRRRCRPRSRHPHLVRALPNTEENKAHRKPTESFLHFLAFHHLAPPHSYSHTNSTPSQLGSSDSLRHRTTPRSPAPPLPETPIHGEIRER